MRITSADIWAAKLSAQWAQQIGLPFGNLWEPALMRHMLSELNQMGDDANARAFLEAKFSMQLGLEGL